MKTKEKEVEGRRGGEGVKDGGKSEGEG